MLKIGIQFFATCGSCGASCGVFCNNGCESTCTNCTSNCTGTCTGTCTSTCSNWCAQHCGTSCTGCGYECAGQCEGCTGGCQDNCSQGCRGVSSAETTPGSTSQSFLYLNGMDYIDDSTLLNAYLNYGTDYPLVIGKYLGYQGDGQCFIIISSPYGNEITHISIKGRSLVCYKEGDTSTHTSNCSAKNKINIIQKDNNGQILKTELFEYDTVDALEEIDIDKDMVLEEGTSVLIIAFNTIQDKDNSDYLNHLTQIQIQKIILTIKNQGQITLDQLYPQEIYSIKSKEYIMKEDMQKICQAIIHLFSHYGNCQNSNSSQNGGGEEGGSTSQTESISCQNCGGNCWADCANSCYNKCKDTCVGGSNAGDSGCGSSCTGDCRASCWLTCTTAGQAGT